MIRTYLDSWKFSKIMGWDSIQNLYLNFSKINPKSTHQGYPPWSALALIRKWPWIKLNIIGVIFQWYNLMIRTYLDSWKFSKMMDDLSIQNLYLNFSKINPKSTQQGYPPWSALALIRVWPWIKLNIIGVIFQWYNLMIRTYLGSWKFSKMMDSISIQNLYLNFSKINQNQPQINSARVPPMKCLSTN